MSQCNNYRLFPLDICNQLVDIYVIVIYTIRKRATQRQLNVLIHNHVILSINDQ